MSINFVEVVQIKSIRKHPHADRLEVATVHGFETVVPKGQFIAGQEVVYFPPDILVNPKVGEDLGVSSYLKHARYDGELVKCRVGACRLRGQPSYGFVVPLDKCDLDGMKLGQNANDRFGAVKYQPPEKTIPGDQAPDHELFHRYTDIQNYARYPDAIPEGTEVRITEKLHGTNSRIGVIHTGASSFEFMCGSHNVAKKNGVYWEPLNDNMMRLLNAVCDERHSVIVFGEIFGPGIQDMHYGLKEKEFRVFDIAVDGKYLDWESVYSWCQLFNVKTVPLLYKGPFYKPQLDLAYGPSCVGGPLREGIVITPVVEQFSEMLCGRMIVKHVSADYLAR